MSLVAKPIVAERNSAAEPTRMVQASTAGAGRRAGGRVPPLEPTICKKKQVVNRDIDNMSLSITD